MAEQVYYENVNVGDEIPKLVKNCTSQQLVMWAAGSGDFYQIHYDRDFAAALGTLPGIIVHGALKHAFLGQMLHDWAGDKGWVKRYGCQYRGMDVPGEDIICRGVITNKTQDGGLNVVELDIWTEKATGDKTSPGKAAVVLPSRG
jgi:acyl dehydratase